MLDTLVDLNHCKFIRLHVSFAIHHHLSYLICTVLVMSVCLNRDVLLRFFLTVMMNAIYTIMINILAPILNQFLNELEPIYLLRTQLQVC